MRIMIAMVYGGEVGWKLWEEREDIEEMHGLTLGVRIREKILMEKRFSFFPSLPSHQLLPGTMDFNSHWSCDRCAIVMQEWCWCACGVLRLYTGLCGEWTGWRPKCHTSQHINRLCGCYHYSGLL